jgi:hypothetical protein
VKCQPEWAGCMCTTGVSLAAIRAGLVRAAAQLTVGIRTKPDTISGGCSAVPDHCFWYAPDLCHLDRVQCPAPGGQLTSWLLLRTMSRWLVTGCPCLPGNRHKCFKVFLLHASTSPPSLHATVIPVLSYAGSDGKRTKCVVNAQSSIVLFALLGNAKVRQLSSTAELERVV